MATAGHRPSTAYAEGEQFSPSALDRSLASRWRAAFGWVDARWFDPLGLLGIVLLVVVWWAISLRTPESQLVSPQLVWDDLRANFFTAPRLQVFGLSDAGYWPTLQYTIRNVAVGVACGGAVGILLGLVSVRTWILRAIMEPIILILGTVPVLIAAPFFLLWFGVLPFTQILLVAFYSGIILLIFSQRAAENLDPVHELWAETLGASSARRLQGVLLPGTVPEILGGLRIALAGAWGLETFGELLGARDGIGQSIAALANLSNVPGLMACVVLVSVAAVVVDALVVVTAAWITRWK